MLGLLTSLLFAGLWTAVASSLLRTRLAGLDPVERVGLCGLLGLGLAGLMTLFIGLIPGGVKLVPYLLALAGLLGVALEFKNRHLGIGKPKPAESTKITLLAFAALSILPLVGALAPANTMEWDSLAYHLAVPKLWIKRGQINYVEAIHHSNFPFTIDNLFLVGQMIGGETGAKAFSFIIYLFGAAWLFGYCRRTLSETAANWAMVLFAGIPVVLWESGTAYIDVGHGLYAAIAMLYAAEAIKGENKHAILFAGLGAGFCMGTKFTGVQIAAALAVGWLIFAPRAIGGKAAIRNLGVALTAAILISGTWYVKTAVLTGNPVYPFFSSVFKTRDWDEWRAAQYKNEQQTFGVGRTESGRDPAAIGHAILGLAYQPGRYVNPGQHQGLGFPTGAVGFAVLLCASITAVLGRARREDLFVLSSVGIGFLMWFFLSQQSRYLTNLVIPLIPTALLLLEDKRWRFLAMGAASLQALYSAGMIYMTQTQDQMKVALGQEEREAYRKRTVSFSDAATSINQLGKNSKVALYDEVFGYFLDVPYFWANPGHSTLIPYETLNTGEEFSAKLKDMGFTHVYLNMQMQDPEFRERWIKAMGVQGTPVPFTEEETATMNADLNLKWKFLIADAVNHHQLRPVQPFRSGLLFEVAN